MSFVEFPPLPNNILIIVLISRHAPKEILSSNRSLLQQFLYLFSFLADLPSLFHHLFTSAVQNQSCYSSLLGECITIIKAYGAPQGSQHPSLSLLSNFYISTSIHLSSPNRLQSLSMQFNNILIGGSELQSSSLRGIYFRFNRLFCVSRIYSHDPTCIICVCLCAITSSSGRLLFVVGLRVQLYRTKTMQLNAIACRSEVVLTTTLE